MKNEKMEISGEGWKIVIPWGILACFFTLNIVTEVVLVSPYCKQLTDVLVFLVFCSFLISIGAVLELFSKPLKTYIEKKLFK